MSEYWDGMGDGLLTEYIGKSLAEYFPSIEVPRFSVTWGNRRIGVVLQLKLDEVSPNVTLHISVPTEIVNAEKGKEQRYKALIEYVFFELRKYFEDEEDREDESSERP